MVTSAKALDYIWLCWNTLGFYKAHKYNVLQKFHIMWIIGFVNSVTLITFIVELFYMENMRQLLRNLPMNVTLIACFIKFFTCLRMREHLIEIDEHFAKLDRRAEMEGKEKRLEDLVAFCKKVTLFVMILYETFVSAAALNASLSNGQLLLFDVWDPYNFRSSRLIYWATLICQFLMFILVALENLTNDVNAPLFLIVLSSHLEIVLERIANIGWTEHKTQQQNYRCLIDAIEDHRVIMKIFNILQNTVGNIMFVQFIYSSVVLSMEALQYIIFPPTLIEFTVIIFFIGDVVLEILLSCYYANNFTIITDKTITAIYSSNIFDQSADFKKAAIIFMQMNQKRRVLVAGKIIPVNLTTFMSVLKVSYSLLTVADRLR